MTATTAPPRSRTTHVVRSRRRRGLAVAAICVLAVVGAGGRSDATASPTWTSPLDPILVVRGFEPPAGPYAPGHRGVDLDGVAGQTVRAAADGVVSYAGQVGGIGVVVVEHGRIRTTYQPLWGFMIPAGAAVSGGAGLGELAPVGSHCAPHPCLHWGALLGETYIDPLSLLDPGPSRLLPYWDTATGPRAPADGRDDGSRLAGAPGIGPGSPRDPSLLRAATGSTVAVPREGGSEAAAARAPRSVPSGVAAGIAVLGGVIAGAAFLAIRRRRG